LIKEKKKRSKISFHVHVHFTLTRLLTLSLTHSLSFHFSPENLSPSKPSFSLALCCFDRFRATRCFDFAFAFFCISVFMQRHFRSLSRFRYRFCGLLLFYAGSLHFLGFCELSETFELNSFCFAPEVESGRRRRRIMFSFSLLFFFFEFVFIVIVVGF